MKRLNILLCAVFCTICAFAQSSFISDVAFEVSGQKVAVDESGAALEDSYTVPSTDAVVSITFNGYDAEYVESNGIIPVLMYTTGTGFAISDPIVDFLNPTENKQEFSLSGKWGNPSMGNYYATIMVCFLDADMEYIFGADGEPLFWQVSYSTPNTNPATFEYAYPNGDWSEETFAEAYENGVITFAFTNPVTFVNGDYVATIVYTVDGEPYTEIVDKSSCEIGWNRLDGYYTVSFQYSSEDFTVEDLSKVTITLNGIEYISEAGDKYEVNVPTITLENSSITPAPRQKKARIANDLSISNTLVNVYNLQGMIVKEGINKSAINELPAGLYIVEGKKIIVR